MSVDGDNNLIRLRGTCGMEDAETLFARLQGCTAPAVDVTEVEGLHTAVVQVLLLMRPRLVGPAPDRFLQDWLMPLMIENQSSTRR
ncbi:hypothetical protein [Rhodobacter sp. NSM]|uniref:hypothetical protein n=1 Tax=Rhodobacter sp. NSM TaxID=3457501 RepID=UPI003FD6A9F7